MSKLLVAYWIKFYCMKKILCIAIEVASALLFINSANAQPADSSGKVLRHIVIITFKAGVNADSIKRLDNVYMELSKSPLVEDFETGVNVSTRDVGVLKHVYVTTFRSKDDMAAYAKGPQFADLFKISLPIAEDVMVVDYWAKK